MAEEEVNIAEDQTAELTKDLTAGYANAAAPQDKGENF